MNYYTHLCSYLAPDLKRQGGTGKGAGGREAAPFTTIHELRCTGSRGGLLLLNVDLSLQIVCASQQTSLGWSTWVIERKESIMSSEPAPNQADKYEQVDITPELEEKIQRIKQPPNIDDALMELSPEERLSNPSVAPEMLNEGEGLRDDLRGD